MTQRTKYQKTLHACYLGYVTQAICANFAPLLFLTFQKTYKISFAQIALIPSVFFMTQLLVDLAAAGFVDRVGYRACVVAAHVLAAAGLALLAILPDVLPLPFAGILLAVMIYAVSSGLIEVLISPIVEACPFEHKESRMSLLHSFYCWGMVAVVLGSTLFFTVFGLENWRVLTLLWALVRKGLGTGRLLRLPVFWLLILLMACAGAAENSMTQWASAFAEAATGVPKTVGDLAGPCLVAVFMGLSRVLCAGLSRNLPQKTLMLGCGVLCVGCYLLASLSPSPALGMAGCALCGCSVGVLWPGTISMSAQLCPAGGTAMFALLALAGDLGGTMGPMTVGFVSELAGGDLKTGLLAAGAFPIALVAGLAALNRQK